VKVDGKKRTYSSSGSGKKLSHFQKKDSHALQQSLALGRKSSIGIEEPSGTEPFEIAAFFLLRSRFFDRRLEREADDQGCLPSRYSFQTSPTMKPRKLALSAIALCAPQLASAALTSSQLSAVFPGATNLTGGTHSLSDMVVTIVSNSSEHSIF